MKLVSVDGLDVTLINPDRETLTLALSSNRLCRNTTNHLDVMLSEREASAFPTA
jgi:hypothetical protein